MIKVELEFCGLKDHIEVEEVKRELQLFHKLHDYGYGFEEDDKIKSNLKIATFRNHGDFNKQGNPIFNLVNLSNL